MGNFKDTGLKDDKKALVDKTISLDGIGISNRVQSESSGKPHKVLNRSRILRRSRSDL